MRALLSYDDGSGSALYVAGDFHGADLPCCNGGLRRWDGTSYSSVGTGVTHVVHALAAFDDGTGPSLWVGGTVDLPGGGSALGVARSG